ncbi:dirigent protein 22-like, partial [Andrographis paniculata]|uniref:dirigent protein 22-like n=1 Tax=Andrographis paniculata TaxID=175694 RepID=UPI0021E738A4
NISTSPQTNSSDTIEANLRLIRKLIPQKTQIKITERPELDSDIVGRAQGMYSNTARNDSALLMAVTFVFTSGKYDGSSVSMLGRNRASDRVREMPIVGGSRAFGMARGYALASTAWFDPETGNACVEYNVSVEHFDV